MFIVSRMISVVIPTYNEEKALVPTLSALVPAAIEGIVSEVVISDGGSRDLTLHIAEDSGAEIISAKKGRGAQLVEGARKAKGRWYLFLHADTVLDEGWMREAAKFIEQVERGERPDTAAAFRFSLDDIGAKPRVLEKLVALRCGLLRMPYGDQGLLISKRLYDQVGGYRPQPIMEDVDLVQRLGRRRIYMMHARAVTCAERFRRDGYAFRSARNVLCQLLYSLRVPHRFLVRFYG